MNRSRAASRTRLILLLLVGLLATAACATTGDSGTPETSTPIADPTAPESDLTDPGATDGPTGDAPTVIRFTAPEGTVDVTIDNDSPAVRDLLARLPMTVSLEEFAGREKIAYLSPRLAIGDTPGSDPEDGDLIYYVPWGNLGFYYDTSGIGYSDDTLHLGTYQATRDELNRLEGDNVTITVVNRAGPIAKLRRSHLAAKPSTWSSRSEHPQPPGFG